MTQQEPQENTGKKGKYSDAYTLLLLPALFLAFFLLGNIAPPSDFIDGLYLYISRMFIIAIIFGLAWGISLLLLGRLKGKTQLWITIIIITAVGILYASGALPDNKHNDYYYEGYRSGYYSGYEDAAEYIRPAYNAGVEAEITIINDPEDYSAEGLYEEWEEDAGVWDIWDDENFYLSDYAFYNK